MKALALFSGGLDSSLAIKLLTIQGIEVIALNFVSYFFGGKNERAELSAKELGVKLEYIDFKEVHKEMLSNPPSGYGKNMNPCIDCHALMIKTAYNMLKKYDADFIITGEVLGQRPMSQNKNALRRVEKLSGAEGYVLRPLSAKLMEETIPEKMGWVDREKLLNLNGRGRTAQMEWAEKFGIKEYPSPGGGCILTEPNYSKRLIILKNDEQFEKSYLFDLIKGCRMYRLEKGKYIFVGRDEESNANIEKYKEKADIFIKGSTIPGPYIIGIGNFYEEEKDIIKQLFARYSKTKGKVETEMNYNNDIILQDKINEELIENIMKENQIK